MIALSLVFVQITEKQEPKVATINKLLSQMTSNKHEEILTRMGAILATGILNAGGRNATLSMTTRDGHLRQNAVVGLVLFLQHWYWYPMLNFISLALTPTVLIAVDKNLKVPKSFKATSKAVPSMYRYPELLKKQEEKTKEKVETVTLSTTAKVKARTDRKNKAEGADVEMSEAPAAEEKREEKAEGEEAAAAEEAKKEQPEPESLVLSNPCRVLKAQELKIVYDQTENRYSPVLETRFSGFVVLRDVREAREGEVEEFYDDEERNMDAPNPDLASDLQIPASFEFDPAIQDAP